MEYLTLSPPVRLAIAYARADLRRVWAILLAFDERLAGAVGRSSEPIFAQMKIAWWQEALAKPAALRPQGEPLLAEIGGLENGIQTTSLIAAMQLLLDAWGIIAAHDNWTSDTIRAVAEARSQAVFGTYAAWVGTDRQVAELGQHWAVDDLSKRFGKDFGDRQNAPSCRMDRLLRSLTILALSARPRMSGMRLVWHALTGG